VQKDHEGPAFIRLPLVSRGQGQGVIETKDLIGGPFEDFPFRVGFRGRESGRKGQKKTSAKEPVMRGDHPCETNPGPPTRQQKGSSARTAACDEGANSALHPAAKFAMLARIP
jgi:hypothetical protein